MITCYLTRRRLGTYLDGALDAAKAQATAAHLATCRACRAEADGFRRLRTLLRTHLSPVEPDWTRFWPGVVRGIEESRAARPARVRGGWWQQRWAFAGALAAASLLLSVGVWQFTPGPRPSEAGVVVNSARTDDPRGLVMVYSTPEQDVAVVWVLGLDR